MAKKFKFRLQKVLELREQERENRKKELMLKNKAVKEVEQRIEELRGKLLSSARVQGEIRAQDLQMVANYEARLASEINASVQALELLVIEADKAKELYLEAVRDHEVLKTLKSRRQDEYRVEAEKIEFQVLDELAVQRYGRKYTD